LPRAARALPLKNRLALPSFFTNDQSIAHVCARSHSAKGVSMIDIRRTIRSGSCVLALVALLSACGGGGSASAPTPTGNGPTGNSGGNTPGNDSGGNTPAAIQGIATPSSVSVVTATNAN
jgi:hypothetical protein